MKTNVECAGVEFENPFVLASAPPTANAEMISRAFEAGWAGAVVKTLIHEPVANLENRFACNKVGSVIYAFKNIELLSELTPQRWYEEIRTLKRRFPNKVVIGSIMGDARDKGHWLDLAAGCQDAGCDMIELNFSCPHGYPEKGKGSAIGQSPFHSANITHWLKSEGSIRVPIVPKLTAAVADIADIGESVEREGADALTAINTYPSLMGFDLKTLKPKPAVSGKTTAGGYSGIGLKPIALRCVSELAKKTGLPIMACGGVASGFDAVEFLLLGARVTQVCTAVMLNGFKIVSQMLREMEEFMGWHGFDAVTDFIGKGNASILPFSELDHAYTVRAQVDPEKCSGCGRCLVSCTDAANQAMHREGDVAISDSSRCTGCSLCFNVCPAGAIRMVEQTEKEARP